MTHDENVSSSVSSRDYNVFVLRTFVSLVFAELIK